MRGVNNQQQNFVYFDPINAHAAVVGDNLVSINPGTGQLGFAPSSGGGNVNGTCTTLGGANFLTKWMNATGGVECSHVYENPTSFFVGVNLPTLNNPLAALDVNGGASSGINTTDTRQSYMIGYIPVLSINSVSAGDNNLYVGPTGTGSAPNAINNTFVGWQAGSSGSGGDNTFSGFMAGNGNGKGNSNVVYGTYAGTKTGDNGSYNAYFGHMAGESITGPSNTILGAYAGWQLKDASSNNVFIGYDAGGDNGGTTNTSNNDIYIGNAGCVYPCAENNTIRIGQQSVQTDTWIQGIYNSTIAGGGSVVCVDPSGKLGTKYPNCSLALQDQIKTGLEQVIAQQQQQIALLQKQNAEFQQRLARLESLIAQK
jgi:hypothetical protein